MSEFFIEVSGVRVRVERKDVKRIRLRVTTPDGQVRVSMPRRTDIGQVKDFVRENLEWIRDAQEKINRRAQRVSDDSRVLLWGQMTPLELIPDSGRSSASFSDAKIVLRFKGAVNDEEKTGLLNEFMRAQLLERMPQVTEKWQAVVGQRADEWRTRVMKTRWGSCNVRSRRIWLNVRLAMLPPQCLDSVTVHELCHLYEASHSSRFYSLMDKYYPEWREADRLMKEFSAVVY